jgi:hypothetical protein
MSAVVCSQYGATTGAAESLIAQLYSQSKLTTPRCENRKECCVPVNNKYPVIVTVARSLKRFFLQISAKVLPYKHQIFCKYRNLFLWSILRNCEEFSVSWQQYRYRLPYNHQLFLANHLFLYSVSVLRYFQPVGNSSYNC